MEFDHERRRDGYYQDQAQEDSPSNQHLVPSGTSSSTSAEAAMAATCSNIEKEHMFDKVVTPSDVGKLNRLVIPKQHAERYFPLDPSSNEKGLLLNFEDRSGKMWRFRYSYWNSSQSYVMTKGWSRFVKEKRLDAGDTVSFSRGVAESSNGHLFIDWKRRPEISEPLRLQPRMPFSMQPSSSNYPMVSFSRSAGTWGSARLLVPNDPNATVYNQHQQINYGYSNAISPTPVSSGSGSGSGQYLVFRSAPPVQMQPAQVLDATLGMPMPMVLDSVPVANSQQAAAKRVRLFGVNLDFQESDGRSQNAGTQSSRVLSSSSSSPSPSGKEEQLSLDLDM